MEDGLSAIYRSRFKDLRDYRYAVWRVLISDYFGRYVPADGAVLDLGCGYGEFINNVSAKQRYAMDLNPDARRELASDVVFLEQDCSSPWPLSDGSLDLVFSSNFFEHLSNKSVLRDVLAQAFRCLTHGGRLVCLGPNIKFTSGTYWDFWDHHIPLTELSLAEVLMLTGFRVLTIVDRFLPFTMAHGPKFPVACLRIYLQWPLIWKLFGKQFLIVASK